MEEPRSSDSRQAADEPPHRGRSPDAFVSPLLLEADEVFRREFPQLLKERPSQWVAYHGSQRIDFAATKEQIVQESLDRGLERGEIFVRCIGPQMGDLFWGPGPIGDLL